MATRALTPVAQRRSRAGASVRKRPGRARDWRQVLLSQDAEAIWRQLNLLVESAAPVDSRGSDQITQELFLHLLATDRISLYIEQDYSDSEIRTDLLSRLRG